MRKISTVLAILALSTSTAFAQDTEASEPAAEEQAATEEAPKIGQPYIKEETGDWKIRCARAPIGKDDPCDMFQLLNNDAGDPVAEIMIQTLNTPEEVAANLVVAAPLGVFLPTGVKISIDGREAGAFPFIVCNTRSCIARVTLKDADVQAFKAGNVAQLTMVPAENTRASITVEASLTGFTAGFEKLPKSE